MTKTNWRVYLTLLCLLIITPAVSWTQGLHTGNAVFVTSATPSNFKTQIYGSDGTVTRAIYANSAGSLATNENLYQVAGTAVDVNSGNKSAGTLRVTLATDQIALTNALKVDLGSTTANATAIKVDNSAVTQPVSGTVTANQGGAPWAGNITQFNSVAVSTAVANTQATVSVTNAATQILATNANRRGGLIVNNGATDIYVGLNASVVSGASAQANGGIRVLAAGGSFSLSAFVGYTGPVYGITAAGSSVVAGLDW